MRGVTEKRPGKFQAQVWRDGAVKYLGIFTSRHKAAIAVKRAREGVTGKQKQQSASSVPPLRRTHKNVRPRILKRGGMAHDAKVGACFLGTYSRLKDAVESVSNFTQTPHSELRLTRKSRQEPPHVSMERFCIMEQAFGDFVPPDIVSARYWRVHGDQTMPMLAPGLQVLSLMAKEDPWRFELDLSWRNTEVHARMCVSGATGSGHEQDRACRLMHKILSACTLSWFKKHASARQFWTEHNLGVAHHSSLLTMLKNCKMLAICSSGTLKWQEDGTRYVLVLYDADVHVPVFTSTHKLGTILRMAPIPCTLSALQKSLAMTRSMVAASGLESWLERPYKFP